MMFEELSAPFAPEAIHWRAQNLTKDGDKALALAYLDARDVMDRLDAVCGPAGWQDSYTETPRGRVVCTLSLLSDGQWIAKSDGAGDTAVEGEKGGISDAFKRSAVKWGIGRYLYDLKDTWAPCESYKGNDGKLRWRRWKPEAQEIFAKALANVGRPTGPINDKTRDWLTTQLEAHGVSAGDLLEHFKPVNLKAITYEQLSEVRQFINSRKKAA